MHQGRLHLQGAGARSRGAVARVLKHHLYAVLALDVERDLGHDQRRWPHRQRRVLGGKRGFQVRFLQKVVVPEFHQHGLGLCVGQRHRRIARLHLGNRELQGRHQLERDAPGQPQAHLLCVLGIDAHEQTILAFVKQHAELVNVHGLDFRQGPPVPSP